MITVKKSYKDGHVSVHVKLKARDWNADSIRIEGAKDLSSAQARELAKALIEEADRADAKMAAKAAADERRQKWRDREIAAGRMRVMSFGEVFGNARRS